MRREETSQKPMTGERTRRTCEFQLLRYVPDAVRNEFVYVGVLLREQGGGRTEVRFTRDWRRVRSLDPDADTELLESLEEELQHLLNAPEGEQLLQRFRHSLSLNVQMTESKAYLAESLPAGVEELMRLYVNSRARLHAQRLGGRAAIQMRMRAEFERAGVWDFLRKRIAVAEYTRQGDPLQIDAGYRPNGVIRMFHAVSLEQGSEMAKVLAFSSAALHAGVERVEGAKLELTAIVEPAMKVGATDEAPDKLSLYRFAVETMEENAIRVLTIHDMERVALRAQQELGVQRD